MILEDDIAFSSTVTRQEKPSLHHAFSFFLFWMSSYETFKPQFPKPLWGYKTIHLRRKTEHFEESAREK